MIPTIVFSRDRAMQLDALLDSLDRNGQGTFSPISVLFQATTSDHARAYTTLISERWVQRVRWIRQLVFSKQVGDLLAHAGQQRSAHVVFFTDDDVLYRTLPPSIEIREPHHDWTCFSLRLGVNTTKCYPLGRSQDFPDTAEGQHFGLVWPWRSADADWGYPMSLDGHVFETRRIQSLLAGEHDWGNPNELEDLLARSVRHAGCMGDLMACCPLSVVVGIPANRVNDTHPNRHADFYSADELLERWLAGERIAWRKMDFSGVTAAHAEIPYVFERRT